MAVYFSPQQLAADADQALFSLKHTRLKLEPELAAKADVLGQIEGPGRKALGAASLDANIPRQASLNRYTP